MANQEHVEILLQGAAAWNTWREENPSIRPDLRHANLASISLQEANLTDADLRSANLVRTNLQKANLEKADLQRANLDHAFLQKANLREVALQQASLRGTNLHKAILEKGNLECANLAGAILTYTKLRRSDLSFCNLAGAKLEFAELRRSKLSQATLREANLNHADLRGAHLQGAKLDRAILHGAVFTKAEGANATFHQADLSRADLRQANFQEADFEEANFYSADLRQARMDESRFSKALLAGAQLQEAILCHADLAEANLEEANLQEANLFRAKLDQASLEHTNLSEANLEESTLKEATFTGAQAIGANLRKANLSGAILDGANFRKADLSQASMNGTPTASHTTVAHTSFGMANMTGTKLPASLNGFRETLKNLEETSKHARMLHAWLVGICLFSLLTVITTGAASTLDTMTLMLPLFQVEIPRLTFLMGIPILGLFMFVYFHFYLSHLYHSLATLPSYFPDGLSLRQRLYPWIINLCIHEWQIQSLGKFEQESRIDSGISTRELSELTPRPRYAMAMGRLLQMGVIPRMIFSYIKTGTVVLIGWGLLPLTIAVLTYPLLIKPDSTVSYIMLALLTFSVVVCMGSCETARCTARGEKVGQRWWMPLAIGVVLVLSGLVLTHQGSIQDRAHVAHNVHHVQEPIPSYVLSHNALP